MTKFNAVIVGGGLGGLTAGATLAKLGKKVLCLSSTIFREVVQPRLTQRFYF
jgi:succinate dehydrogenase/fumarate reductase flavoprotein subunit